MAGGAGPLPARSGAGLGLLVGYDVNAGQVRAGGVLYPCLQFAGGHRNDPGRSRDLCVEGVPDCHGGGQDGGQFAGEFHGPVAGYNVVNLYPCRLYL